METLLGNTHLLFFVLSDADFFFEVPLLFSAFFFSDFDEGGFMGESCEEDSVGVFLRSFLSFFLLFDLSLFPATFLSLGSLLVLSVDFGLSFLSFFFSY